MEQITHDETLHIGPNLRNSLFRDQIGHSATEQSTTTSAVVIPRMNRQQLSKKHVVLFLGYKMITRYLPFLAFILALGACAPTVEMTRPQATGPTRELPEAVSQLAAPYQNVASARVLPEDGCYWYVHEGPVETTLLPLRTVDGRPICTTSSATTTE